ncbi:MAG: hypothetical protein AB6733_03025 [Clostridiaceae bacterium]
MKKNKIIALLLAFSLTVGFISSSTTAYAATVNSTNTGTLVVTNELKENTKNNREIVQGIKSKAVLKIANLLVKNTNKLIGTLKGAGVIDGESALVLGSNCYRISSYLESIANYADDAAAFVRSNLPSVLRSWGISSGISENLAYALSWAIKVADWLF